MIYSCSSVAENYPAIATKLYNVAFVTCWKVMSDYDKERILENYLWAIESTSKPSLVL